MKGLVSIVIPVYGGEPYLAEAIESCLSQTYEAFEVIVVDDASPDRCAEMAAEFGRRDTRVRLLRRGTNGGVSRAFNTGFESARGEFMTRLAQDDYFAPDAVQKMVDCLQSSASLGLVYAGMREVDVAGQATRDISPPLPDTVLADGNSVGLCVMWRRDVWEAVGPFDPSYDAAEDYEYWTRIARRYRLGRCEGAPLLFVRVHPAMGSIVYRPQQEVAAARVRARECGDWLMARRIQAVAHYDAGYAFRGQGRTWRACAHLLRSWVYWPFDRRPYRSILGLVWSPVGRLIGRGRTRRKTGGPSGSAGRLP